MKIYITPVAIIVILTLGTLSSAFQYDNNVVKETKTDFVVEQEIVIDNYDVETAQKLQNSPHHEKMSNHQYLPDWNDLDKRPLPKWFDEAKIGIFIHWGVFSVPSYRSEWFWADWKLRKFENCVDFMKKNYRPGFTYADFAPQFTAEFFDADQWADIFNKSGARYVVLTSKHHEGFTNWPSAYSYSWNSMDVGPKRDLVGELSNALRKKNLHVGLYHSLFEWFNPLFLEDQGYHFTTQSFVEQKAMPELYELVNNYRPDVLWSDGDWAAPDTYWNSTHFLAWLYNESPVKDTVVTNDRWGSGCMCKHGGYFTCHDRYNPGKLQPRKWENAMTIDTVSWGYRRNATLSEYITIEQLLGTLVETISCGGNILVNIGPSHDGIIHPIFQERLSQMGQWLGVNGEAIYSSSPWKYQNDTVTPKVWYTAQPADGTVYAITLQWPEKNNLFLGAPVTSAQTTVSLLGSHLALQWSKGEKGGMNIMIPPISYTQIPCKWAWVFRIRRLQNF